MYYNTTKLDKTELRAARDAAKTQDERVLYLFKLPFDTVKLTPSEVLDLYMDHFKHEVPITSIRRSMNSLTNKGHIVKTNVKSISKWGRPEYNWKLTQ